MAMMMMLMWVTMTVQSNADNCGYHDDTDGNDVVVGADEDDGDYDVGDSYDERANDDIA